ncbi:MAG: hypothetical protein KJ077_13150 [Anaerolineae bacterium]|nr:hypothetical protein [Anaerolineae bacterium]
MSNTMDSISASGKPLSDEELMDLLIKVRRGELSPEEAERLLSGLPGFEADAGPGLSGPAEPISERGESRRPSEGHAASAPLGQARRGTLILDTLAAYFNINSAALGADLFQAHYTRSLPSVWVDGSTVTARFNYFSLGALREWLRQQQGDHPRAEFTLNTAIPWQLELRSHMSNLTVNLHGVRLAGLEGNGSMNSITLSLDRPKGDVPIHYDAIASSLEVNCPAQCPLRVEVLGNTNAADIAGRKFASKSAWQTPDFDTAPDRYSIVFSGEASSLSVTYK